MGLTCSGIKRHRKGSKSLPSNITFIMFLVVSPGVGGKCFWHISASAALCFLCCLIKGLIIHIFPIAPPLSDYIFRDLVPQHTRICLILFDTLCAVMDMEGQ